MTAWQEKAKAKKQEVDNGIPPEWKLPSLVLHKYTIESKLSVLEVPDQFLSAKEKEITALEDVPELLLKIASGVYSSVEVTQAFLHRAVICNQLTNCCTEFLIDYAINRAQELDEHLAATGETKGPLHGLPISLKDSFNLPGVADSTIGYVVKIGNANSIPQSNLVTLLLDQGAVPYVKTNVPQGMMGGDSENNIFGRVLNPSNLSWTAGGSTGGEGALVKQHGSILGVGTDGAGSIRIPSLCNGVYGFKPTGNRIPNGNQTNPTNRPPIGTVTAAAGPISNKYSNLKFFFHNVLGAEPWRYDDLVVPVALQPTQPKEKLTVGLILEDPHFPVFKEVKQIYTDAADKLRQNGHTVIVLDKFPSYEEAWRLALAQFCIRFPDDKEPNPAVAGGEPFIASAGKSGTKTYVKKFPTDFAGAIESVTRSLEVAAEWKRIFFDLNLDAIIAPPCASTAPPHDTYGIAPYTCMWNLVDFPALAIPYGKVDKYIPDDRKYPEILKDVYPHPDETAYLGGVGSIQVIGLPLNDESLLEAGEAIDQVLNGGR